MHACMCLRLDVIPQNRDFTEGRLNWCHDASSKCTCHVPSYSALTRGINPPEHPPFWGRRMPVLNARARNMAIALQQLRQNHSHRQNFARSRPSVRSLFCGSARVSYIIARLSSWKQCSCDVITGKATVFGKSCCDFLASHCIYIWWWLISK
jgi:hypothetical protein